MGKDVEGYANVDENADELVCEIVDGGANKSVNEETKEGDSESADGRELEGDKVLMLIQTPL